MKRTVTWMLTVAFLIVLTGCALGSFIEGIAGKPMSTGGDPAAHTWGDRASGVIDSVIPSPWKEGVTLLSLVGLGISDYFRRRQKKKKEALSMALEDARAILDAEAVKKLLDRVEKRLDEAGVRSSMSADLPKIRTKVAAEKPLTVLTSGTAGSGG